MSPGLNSILVEPEASLQFRQVYKEGFEAGKASLRKELKQLIAKLPDKQIFTETSSTYSNHYEI